MERKRETTKAKAKVIKVKQNLKVINILTNDEEKKGVGEEEELCMWSTKFFLHIFTFFLSSSHRLSQIYMLACSLTRVDDVAQHFAT
jgi:hypothetical protein